MENCDTCGNAYDKSFEIKMNDKKFTFDCFECAIHALAPQCRVCECRILGHGTESNSHMYCSAHCARKDGVDDLADRS